MYSNGLKNIVVFLTDLHGEYQHTVCRSICNAAKALNYNVAILNWDHPFTNIKKYVDGASNIFELPDYENVDGIIYLKDTFMQDEVEHKAEEHFKKNFKGPVVSVRCRTDDFYNVLTDDASGITAMTEHLIRDHHLKKIAYMSGKRELEDARIRLKAYCDTMDKYGLEYDESYIFHGDYWKYKGGEALDHFFASHYGIPEAIVCANDYMAISVMRELVDRGYKVPDDIAVTGFDNISDARECIPSLTTVNMPVSAMGKRAVEVIDNVLNNREQEKISYVLTEPVFRGSCGCPDTDIIARLMGRNRSESDKQKMLSSMRALRYMSVALEGAFDLKQVSHVVDNYIYMNETYKNFFLNITRKDPTADLNTVSKIKNGYTDESLCALAIIDRGHTEDYPLIFNTKELIPPMYVDESPQSYCFMPLHFLENNYGYVAVNYMEGGGMEIQYASFVTSISSSLDNIYNKVKLRKALSELEKLYVTDPLTNLFNRRGFEKYANKMFDRCRKKKTIMVMTIDMDDMKRINDNFGHMQGDVAIQILGKALLNASVNGEVCARVGGDEFNVVAEDYTQELYEEFIENVLEYLKQFNDSNALDYSVNISYGGVLIDKYEVNNFEYYMNISDNRMYEHKSARKAGRQN